MITIDCLIGRTRRHTHPASASCLSDSVPHKLTQRPQQALIMMLADRSYFTGRINCSGNSSTLTTVGASFQHAPLVYQFGAFSLSQFDRPRPKDTYIRVRQKPADFTLSSSLETMSSRQPYHGSHRKLVLAFDIGTTYSGVSYSILGPGLVPEIRAATRYATQVI
jgi:hypothetical protein